MKYLLLAQPNSLQAPAIAFSTVLPPEFGLGGYVDRAAQFDLVFRQPLNRALALIGWRDKKRRTLGVRRLIIPPTATKLSARLTCSRRTPTASPCLSP
jgi:hypothetical protein